MIRKLIFVLLGLAFGSPLYAGEASGWTLEKAQDGITVYSREREDSSYREFRAEGIIEAELNQLLGLLDDTAACPRWMHNCLAPVLLAEPHVLQRYTYMRNNLPWPYKDRALLVRSTIHPEGAAVRVLFEGIPVSALPPAARQKLPDTADYPYAERFAGEFRFTPVDGGHQVVYQLHIDLGGSPPARLANGVIAQTPLKTLVGMRARVGEYQDFVIPAWE